MKFTLCFSSFHLGMRILEALPQSHHLGAALRRTAAQEVLPRSGFSVFFAFVGFAEGSVLQWPECKSCHQPPEESNATAGGRPQTRLGSRYGWPLAHKELLCSLKRCIGQNSMAFFKMGCLAGCHFLSHLHGAKDAAVQVPKLHEAIECQNVN